MFNSFGNILRLTSFGESHGKGIGGVIDGFPAGIRIDMDFVQAELNRRRPGQSLITTARKEGDKVEFLSGIFEGKSTGCPIGFIVWNENQHSSDYDNMKEVYRPSHADYTYKVKYGIRDYRGGGRSSARETISRVVAGALAKQALRQLGVRITAYTSQVGPIRLEENYTACFHVLLWLLYDRRNGKVPGNAVPQRTVSPSQILLSPRHPSPAAYTRAFPPDVFRTDTGLHRTPESLPWKSGLQNAPSERSEYYSSARSSNRGLYSPVLQTA